MNRPLVVLLSSGLQLACGGLGIPPELSDLEVPSILPIDSLTEASVEVECPEGLADLRLKITLDQGNRLDISEQRIDLEDRTVATVAFFVFVSSDFPLGLARLSVVAFDVDGQRSNVIFAAEVVE